MDFLISAITKQARDVITTALIILMAVISISIIIVVMMQESASGGVGAISGSNDSFYGKNKGQTKEVILKRATLILGAVMLVISVVFFVVKSL